MRKTACRLGFALPLAALVVAAPLLSAVSDRAPQRRFIAGVELVAVDFTAVDSTGRPVTDLRPEEVSVRVDGRPRVVRSLQYVPVARQPLAEGPAAPLPEPYGSNSLADAGRSFLMVVDDESFRAGREVQMRQAVDEFLAGLSRRDRVALVTIPHGSTRVDLTTDHPRLSTALLSVVGHAPQRLDASDEACRTRRTLEALDSLLRGLVNHEGPMNVMFFSASLLAPRRDAIATQAPGVCEITTEHFQFVGQSAAASRALFFVILPTEVMPDPTYEATNFNAVGGSANPMEGLEHLAGVTGGHRLTLATAQARPLDRVLMETSGYYMVGFEPEGSDRNGNNHGFDVSISRPGVTQRARPNIFIASARPDEPVPTITPADMLREARVYRDLPLRVTGYSSRGTTPDEVQIAVLGEAAEPTAAIVAAAAGLFDSEGRLIAQWTANDSDVGRRAVFAAVSATPGTYRLRFAARDADGRTGTADTEIVAGLARAGQYELSSALLGLMRPGRDGASASFQPRLEFTTEPVAIAYIEVYGGQAGNRVAANVEIATSVDGPPVIATPLAIQPTDDDNRFLAMGAVPIGGLPAGDYVVRVNVGAEGEVPAQVLRTLRKSAG